MILLSHPTGNANARQAALGLSEAGLLGELWTTLAWDEQNVLGRFLPDGWRKQLARRQWPKPVRDRLRTAPGLELCRLVSARVGLTGLIAHESGPFCIDAVFSDLDRRVARRLGGNLDCTGVYAYEDGAVASFRAAQTLGLKRIYDLPIGYWRAGQAIYREEAEREPEWAATLTGVQDSAAKLARKDEELSLASTVLVASTFTRRTLEMTPGFDAPVHVIPYGAPVPVEKVSLPRRTRRGSALRVLFAGSLTQRKGLTYLLKAVDRLASRVELTLIGGKPVQDCVRLNEAVTKHRWIPSLPHAEMLREMAAHDVLVFPSLFEGFGLVITEALSQGIPVITTSHTAGPDILTEGRDGFIVPIRDWEAIADRLERLCISPDLLAEMKENASRTARFRGWEQYRSLLVERLHPMLEISQPPLISPGRP